jgi:hypothetical protein
MIKYAPLLDGNGQLMRIELFLKPSGNGRRGQPGDEAVEFAFFELVVWHIVV